MFNSDCDATTLGVKAVPLSVIEFVPALVMAGDVTSVPMRFAVLVGLRGGAARWIWVASLLAMVMLLSAGAEVAVPLFGPPGGAAGGPGIFSKKRPRAAAPAGEASPCPH